MSSDATIPHHSIGLAAQQARESSRMRTEDQESLWPRIEAAVAYLTTRSDVNHFGQGIRKALGEQR